MCERKEEGERTRGRVTGKERGGREEGGWEGGRERKGKREGETCYIKKNINIFLFGTIFFVKHAQFVK